MKKFLKQVLEAIAPPYSPEFVQLFLPMVENEEITGTMRGDGDNDLVSEFISKYSVFFTIYLKQLSFFSLHYFLQFTAKFTAQQLDNI